jgi:hypothetical protein
LRSHVGPMLHEVEVSMNHIMPIFLSLILWFIFIHYNQHDIYTNDNVS